MKKLIFILLISTNLYAISQDSKTNPEYLINKMHESIIKYNQLRFSLYRSERSGDEFIVGSFDAKLQSKPYKFYLKNKIPSEGSEILYIEGVNNGKAWVNPNSFPFITISLKPENSLLLAGGHHTIKEAGFMFFDKMFISYQKKYKDNIFDYLSYKGLITSKGVNYHKFLMNYPDYRFLSYTVKSGENLQNIAFKRLLNIAKLKALNPSYNDTEIIPIGTKIKITSSYAKKAIFMLDVKSYLPVYQEIHDEKGVYEKYFYTNVITNKPILAEEFSPKYASYNF